MRFVIIDSKDRYRDSADDIGEAARKGTALAKGEPGTKFYTYQQIREYGVPTPEQDAEQKAHKDFWK